MGEATKIQWAHHTWSPWRGCTKVSEGCRNCYAEALSKRNPKTMGVWGPTGHRAINADWEKPLRWNEAARKAGERRRVFPSLCDWLEDREDLDKPLARFLDLIDQTPHLDWLLLTKRPELFRKRLFATADTMQRYWNAVDWIQGGKISGRGLPPNLWLGTSVENQATADERIPKLARIPAAVRWLSIEPLLASVRILSYFGPQSEGQWMNVVECGHAIHSYGVNWVVVGGESGPRARPCDLRWIRSIVGQCCEANVPVFVKQLGAQVEARDAIDPLDQFPGSPRFRQGRDMNTAIVQLAHKKGGDPAEWPEDLRIREFPTPRTVEAS